MNEELYFLYAHIYTQKGHACISAFINCNIGYEETCIDYEYVKLGVNAYI